MPGVALGEWNGSGLEFTEPGFIVIEVEAPPGPYQFGEEPEVQFIMDGRPALGYTGTYRDGHPLSGPTVLFTNGEAAGAELRTGRVDESIVIVPPLFVGWYAPVVLSPGTQRVVLFTSGDVDYWNFNLSPSDMPWRVIATGPTHFGSGARSVAGDWVAAHAVAGSVYVANAVRIDIPVQHSLAGFFLPDPGFPFGGVYAGARFSGPGLDEECPCHYTGARFGALPGPGNYSFDWSGVGVAQIQVPIYAWADVPLT